MPRTAWWPRRTDKIEGRDRLDYRLSYQAERTNLHPSVLWVRYSKVTNGVHYDDVQDRQCEKREPIEILFADSKLSEACFPTSV